MRPPSLIFGPAFVPFPEPQVEARFVARRQRFLADVEFGDGSRLTAHCPNTGSMKGCLHPGRPVLLWDSRNDRRKLRYTWKAVEAGGFWIGVDTGVPNRLVEAALRSGSSGEATIRREVALGDRSRIDLLVEDSLGRTWVEVKNVTLVEDGAARFPDAVTTRGLRHLDELAGRAEAGDRAAMVYLVQREDGTRFEPAEDLDPAYAAGLRAAAARGVEVYALGARVTPKGVTATSLLPVRLDSRGGTL